jgi:putative zinc finger/helix-turn-helix YgiT family protein
MRIVVSGSSCLLSISQNIERRAIVDILNKKPSSAMGCLFPAFKRDQEGMDFVDGETMNKNLLIRQDAYRKKAGLLTSEDIKAIRKIYHLSQKDFGQILGLGQIDIARYETKAVQTRSINDLLLRSREDPLWFYGKYCSFAPQMTLDKRMEVAKAIEAYSSSKGIKEIACKKRHRFSLSALSEPS